jgi:hypothetical protein
MILQSLKILLLSLIAMNVYSSNNKFKSFVAGDYSSMQSIFLSLESFDPDLGKQVGTILNTLNLDKKFQILNQNYKECIFNLTISSIDFTFDELFLELDSKCINEKKLISDYIKEISAE